MVNMLRLTLNFSAPLIGVGIVFLWVSQVSGQTPFTQVKLGNQIWMSQSLGLTNFQNGDHIETADNSQDWVAMKETPRCASPAYDASGSLAKGKVYSMEAITDPRGICPKGWRLPTQEDVEGLRRFTWNPEAQRSDVGVLKTATGWAEKNGNDKAGFHASPDGFITLSGRFLESYPHGGKAVRYWYLDAMGKPAYFSLDYLHEEIVTDSPFYGEGYFCRCIKN
jgi:uncharacterized protein (TIGR02145 family)